MTKRETGVRTPKQTWLGVAFYLMYRTSGLYFYYQILSVELVAHEILTSLRCTHRSKVCRISYRVLVRRRELVRRPISSKRPNLWNILNMKEDGTFETVR